MKNKFGNDIHLVKVELISAPVRESILEARRITCSHVSYSVAEYLAPANVLICSKCCGLGHFRKQCTEASETCRKCGQCFPEIKHHRCNSAISCKHCKGDHHANSMKCPVVRAFRADLTRKLLNKNNSHHSDNGTLLPSSIGIQYPFPPRPPGNISTQGTAWNPPPPLLNPWMPRMSATMDGGSSLQIENLISGLAKIHETLNRVCESNARLEAAIVDQNVRTRGIENEMILMNEKSTGLAEDLDGCKNVITSLSSTLDLSTKLTKQVTLPIVSDILLFLGSFNKDGVRRVLDVDVKSRFERYRIEVIKALEGNSLAK